MSILEAILAADDLQVREVSTPEWKGVRVFIRTIKGNERRKIEAMIKEDGKPVTNSPDMLARICALLLCDEKGERICKDEDAAKLGEKSLSVLNRIVETAIEFNGMTKKGQEDLGNSSTSSPTS